MKHGHIAAKVDHSKAFSKVIQWSTMTPDIVELQRFTHSTHSQKFNMFTTHQLFFPQWNKQYSFVFYLFEYNTFCLLFPNTMTLPIYVLSIIANSNCWLRCWLCFLFPIIFIMHKPIHDITIQFDFM